VNSISQILAKSCSQVEALLNPRNVVIVGASDTPGSYAMMLSRNLNRYGYPGPIYPINPRREQVWGGRCYASFDELPEKPDHIVVVTPAPTVPDVVRAGAKAGARSVTVMTSGFEEAPNEAGKELGQRLAAVIADTGLAVSGPNCGGNLHAPSKLMTMTDLRRYWVVPGPAALVAQSGGVAMALKRVLDERGVSIGSLVTSGNETGLNSADYIAYYASLRHLRIIVCYVESIRDPEKFLAACHMAREAGKPVVVIKLGVSEGGRAAAMAHTGALAGSIAAFDAVARESGMIRARTLDEAAELIEYCAHAPLPGGKRVGAITFSGALRGLLLDHASEHGLEFPSLAQPTRQRLEALLGVGSIIGNPLDSGFAGLGSTEVYLACVKAMLDDPCVDVLLLQEELMRGPGQDLKEANIRGVNELAGKSGKPVAHFSMISYGLTDYSRTLRSVLGNVPFLHEVEKTMRTVRAVADYAVRSATPEPSVISVAKEKARLDKQLARSSRGATDMALTETASKNMLKVYGVRVPKEGLARSEREAVAHAARVGYPVVAKAVSASLSHKSEVGGVILGLKSGRDVRDAYRTLSSRVAKHRHTLDGVLIARQVSDGLELILGMNRDPDIGPVILFGAGGIDTELTRDVALAALPLDEKRALELIGRTRVSRLIDGYRGRPPLDRGALVHALLALSRLVMDAGKGIRSIDINPFLLKKRGGVALDALVVLAGKD